MIKWAITGTGWIAKQFASDFQHVDGAQLVGVCARDTVKVDAFREEFSLAESYTDIDQFLSLTSADAIYIATPHISHHELMKKCLLANKHVLCEKPFCINAHEAKEVFEIARSKKLFAAEAMWTLHLPAMQFLLEKLKAGDFADIKQVEVSIGFPFKNQQPPRLFLPELAGGSLLDLGVYCLSITQAIFGTAKNIQGYLDIGETGVDEKAAWILSFPKDKLATGSCSINTELSQRLLLNSSTESIEIKDFWQAKEVLLDDKKYNFDFSGSGLQFQVIEANSCIEKGLLESQVVTQAHTLSVLGTMDTIRQQNNFLYPNEISLGSDSN